MSFLVISRRHELLPFAHRLRNQGETVEVLVSSPAFQKAWGGSSSKVLKTKEGELNEEILAPIIKMAEEGKTTVLTNDWEVQTVFGNAKRLYGVIRNSEENPAPNTLVRLGCWFNGEDISGIHLLVVDQGAWIGGQGPEIDSAITLIRNEKDDTTRMVRDLIAPHLDPLKSQSFKGLVQFGLRFDTASGEPEVVGVHAGWPFLHTHVFVSELHDFSGLLQGQSSVDLDNRFVFGLVLSRPPYPNNRARLARYPSPIGGLTDQQIARVFWHDVRIDEEDHSLSTAGLDGLVGVIRGSADTFALARGLALEVAGRVHLNAKQVRIDAGQRVDQVLGELEQKFGLTLF